MLGAIKTLDISERVKEEVRLKLPSQNLQTRGCQLPGADLSSAIKMQRMCGADDHDVNRNLDAGEVEKVPSWRWWGQALPCGRFQIGGRDRRGTVVRARAWVDKNFPLVNAPND